MPSVVDPPNKNDIEPQPSSPVYHVVIIGVLLVVLGLSFVAFWFNHNRLRNQLLSQKEVAVFYNGDLINSSNEQENDCSNWLGMEFPTCFQIGKNRIELGRLIGFGEFGEVFVGKLDEETDVAVKIPKSNASSEAFKSALSEVKILFYLGNGGHPNVISFLGAYTKDICRGKLYILTEYCHSGSLLSYLRDMGSEMRDEANKEVDLFQMYRFAFQIASGMEFVSAKRVIHGDLAARNVLLTSDLTIKITDFGLSRKLYEYTKYVKKSQQPLPWKWTAPESLKHMEFTTKSDVWSYGITIWEIFNLGGQPYPSLAWTPGYANDLMNGLRLEKANYASKDIHEMLMECWNVSPGSRPTFTEVGAYFAELGSGQYTLCSDINLGLEQSIGRVNTK